MTLEPQSKLAIVLSAIDEINLKDPNRDEATPEAFLYGERMSEECLRLFPDAPDLLQIAARGQHIERWIIKRSDYPEGRVGYLTWRRDLAKHHANRVQTLMKDAGYAHDEMESVGKMLRKEGLKRDELVQALEDVICFVFLKWYFTPFAQKHNAEKIKDIVEKTARKMSPEGRARVLKEFPLPEALAQAFS